MGHEERLSALDAAFLRLERGGVHMHLGAVAIFEGGELLGEDGGVDFDRLRSHFDGALDRMPRHRQRLAEVPGLGTWAWVDDDHFNLDYHLRHTALPRPGDERQLKRLAGRIFSQRLDRDRPLWETWIVEGLTGGRFAVVLKAHHAMVDGIGGVQVLAALLGPEAAAKPWTPRAPASGLELVKDELSHRASEALAQGRALAKAVANPKQLLSDTAQSLRQTTGLLRTGFSASERTPLNPEHIGPHRRFDVLDIDLSAMKAVKRTLGGKVNDVVLATVAGALGRFLTRRGVSVADRSQLRALVPADVRRGYAGMGNRVGLMFADLPLTESDPARRYARVLESTTHIKHEAEHARATELIESMSDWLAPSVVSLALEYVSWIGSFNVIVTNVPGPQFPVRLLGAKLQALHPLVPLFEGQSLGIALFSYDGSVGWGLNADWSTVGDLHLLADDLRASFDELHAAAG